MTQREAGSKQAPPSERPTSRPLFSGDKAVFVRNMFSDIAPRYDLLNFLLSFGQHNRWRRLAIRMAGIAPGSRCLDVCTGTADLAIEAARKCGPDGSVIGGDFCRPMVRLGVAKLRTQPDRRTRLMVADAQRLPYPSEAFDAVTVGFGVRNVADLARAVCEMARVARPRGTVTILEFNRPVGGITRPMVDFYLFHVLPRIGALFCRGNAYTYLPESMKQFVTREALASLMRDAGLTDIVIKDLNFGTVCIHTGRKPAAQGMDGNV